MKVLVVLALAAAFVVPAARADVPPAGFVLQAGLSSKAAFVAGKPVSVYCATDDASWQTALQQNREVADVLAFADAVGGSSAYLSPTVCAPLLWAKPKQASYLLQDQGAAIEVLAHEAEHLAGHVNEGETECAALAILPRFANAKFGITTAPRMRWIMAGARSRHRAAEQFSPVYVGACG